MRKKTVLAQNVDVTHCLEFFNQKYLKVPDKKNYVLKNDNAEFQLIKFWSLNCPLCRLDFQDINNLRRSFSEDQLQIVTLLGDEIPEKVEKFMNKNKVEHPVFIDTEGRLFDCFHVREVPSIYIFKNKKLVFRFNSLSELPDKDPLQFFNKIMQEND